MKSGRKTTPTALRRLHGNPGRRALPKGEPEPPGALHDVRPPPHLSREARQEWRRLAPELCALGLLTVADLAIFAAYASAWGDFVEADRALRVDGLVTQGKEGQLVRSPWILIKARAVDQLVKIGDRFGLSPTARVGLSNHDLAGPSPFRPGDQGSLAAFLAMKPDDLT